MTMLAGLLLLISLGATLYFVRHDRAEYAAFKQFTETSDRQRMYRRWLLRGFALFACATLVGLAILGRLRALVSLPTEFSELSQQLRAALPVVKVSAGFLVGVGCGMLAALIASAVGMTVRKRPQKILMLGDIQPLMPRNWAETAHTALLSLNAGFGEEMFFRLFLPLLMTMLIGHAAICFGVAAVLFGLVHIYQGVVGVIATMVVGFVFTGIYLWSGELWIAICVHAAMDLVGLVVRPSIVRLAGAWRRSSSADEVRS